MIAIDFQFKALTTIKKNPAIYVNFEFKNKSLYMKNDSEQSLYLTYVLTGDFQNIVFIIVINTYYLVYNKITLSIHFVKNRHCVNNSVFYIFFRFFF